MEIKKVRQVVSAIAFATLFLGPASGSAAEYVSVKGDEINVRSSPITQNSNNIIYKAPQHYPLKVIAEKAKWLKVEDYESDVGWIYNSLVSQTQYVIIKVKKCNIRSGPGTNYAVLGPGFKEARLKKVKEQGDWIKFSHPDLKEGWVHKNLVWP